MSNRIANIRNHDNQQLKTLFYLRRKQNSKVTTVLEQVPVIKFQTRQGSFAVLRPSDLNGLKSDPIIGTSDVKTIWVQFDEVGTTGSLTKDVKISKNG